MAKSYVCKLDNESFSSKEELIDHLVDKYSMVDESEGLQSHIVSRLMNAFPFAQVNVKVNEENPDSYRVSMDWKPKYEDADFDFVIGKRDESEVYYLDLYFKNVEEAIMHYQNFINKYEVITEKLKEKYNPDNIYIGQFFEDSYHQDRSSILFHVVIDGETYSKQYEFGDVDEFISMFNGYFLDRIEGELELERCASTGHEIEYWVGGIPIASMLKRARKVRIEILE